MFRRSMLVAVLAAAVVLPAFSARAESWGERTWRQVHRKVAFELVDTKLSEACDFLSTLTGLNIILAPTVRQRDPTLSLRVQDMDAGTALKWFTQLTETYADVVDQAIYITDKPNEKLVEEEKDDLVALCAAHNVVPDMPPAGMRLTDQDRVKIALQIMEKEQIKVQDFPGPEINIGTAGEGQGFVFGQK